MRLGPRVLYLVGLVCRGVGELGLWGDEEDLLTGGTHIILFAGDMFDMLHAGTHIIEAQTIAAVALLVLLIALLDLLHTSAVLDVGADAVLIGGA